MFNLDLSTDLTNVCEGVANTWRDVVYDLLGSVLSNIGNRVNWSNCIQNPWNLGSYHLGDGMSRVAKDARCNPELAFLLYNNTSAKILTCFLHLIILDLCTYTKLCAAGEAAWIDFMHTNKGAHMAHGNTSSSSMSSEMSRGGPRQTRHVDSFADTLSDTLTKVPSERLPPVFPAPATLGPDLLPSGLWRAAPQGSATPINELKGLSSATMPVINTLGNLVMIPTQLLAYMESSSRYTTWSASMLPADMYAHKQVHVLADGSVEDPVMLRRRSAFTQQISVQDIELRNPVLTKSTYHGLLPVSLYTGHENKEPLRLHSVLNEALSAFVLKDTKLISEWLEPHRQIGKHIRPNPAGQMQTGVQRYRSVANLWSTNSGVSYVRFFTVAWLDFFANMSIFADGGAAAWNFAGANAHGYPAQPTRHYCDVGPRRPVAIVGHHAGGEEAIWDFLEQFHDGRAFFIDASSLDTNTIRLAMRYAQTWPPERIRSAGVGNPALQAHTYLIPGATHMIIHTGTVQVPLTRPDVGNVPLGYVEPAAILRFIQTYMVHTNAIGDVRLAFELASAMAFGVDSDRWQNGLGAGRNGNAVPRLISPLLHEANARLPQDSTILEYFRPCVDTSFYAADVSTLFTSRPNIAYFLGMTLNKQLACAVGAANYVCSLTSDCYTNRAALTEIGVHASALFGRANRMKLSLFDCVVQNSCATMFGWAPNEMTLLSVDHSLPPPNMNIEIGNYYRAATIPLLVLGYECLPFVNAMPDFYMLPIAGGVVKWPEDHAYPLRDMTTGTRFVRLGATMKPLDNKLWVGDGGSMYSAQYYAAINGANGPVHEGNQNVVSMTHWLHPHEFEPPTAPVAAHLHRLPAPLDDYLYPGMITSYAHGVRNTKAWAARLLNNFVVGGAAVIASREWQCVARKEPDRVPTLELHSHYAHTVERPGDTSYVLLALHDRMSRNFAGLTVLPRSAFTTGGGAGGQLHTARLASGLISGPAAIANINAPQYGTQRTTYRQADVYGWKVAGGRNANKQYMKKFNKRTHAVELAEQDTTRRGNALSRSQLNARSDERTRGHARFSTSPRNQQSSQEAGEYDDNLYQHLFLSDDELTSHDSRRDNRPTLQYRGGAESGNTYTSRAPRSENISGPRQERTQYTSGQGFIPHGAPLKQRVRTNASAQYLPGRDKGKEPIEGDYEPRAPVQRSRPELLWNAHMPATQAHKSYASAVRGDESDGQGEQSTRTQSSSNFGKQKRVKQWRPLQSAHTVDSLHTTDQLALRQYEASQALERYEKARSDAAKQKTRQDTSAASDALAYEAQERVPISISGQISGPQDRDMDEDTGNYNLLPDRGRDEDEPNESQSTMWDLGPDKEN